MNKEIAVRRIQLWWRIIKTCNQYYISQEKYPFDQEVEDEWGETSRHPLKRDYLLNVNQSFTGSCQDCCKKFRFCPDCVFYYTRKNRLEYKKIACGYCKYCFETRLFSYLNYFISWPHLRFNGSEFHLGKTFVHENYRFKVRDIAKKVIVPTVYRCNYNIFHRFKGNRIQSYNRPQEDSLSGIKIGFHENNHCDFGGIT